MEKKELVINSKTYIINEIKYKDLTLLADIPKDEAAKKLMLLSTNMSEEDYDELGMKAGMEIQKVINDLNGLLDFQKPLTE